MSNIDQTTKVMINYLYPVSFSIQFLVQFLMFLHSIVLVQHLTYDKCQYTVHVY